MCYFEKSVWYGDCTNGFSSTKPIALSSAVCMKIDQRALENGSVGHNNDSPTYVIHNPTTQSTNTRSEVSCSEENNPPSFMMVDDIDKGSKISDDLENENDRM